ncbi:MAG: acireductone synthase [Acidobacteriia bacterium]|nr:acireductone synthase [Terriglobia bacterium]
MPVRGILLDIEGTTTPIDFVYQILFPYARTHCRDFLAAHWPSEEVQSDIARLLEEHAEDKRRGLEPPDFPTTLKETQPESVLVYILWLMDQDRKSTGLKSLQGKIWQNGYRTGTLRSQVFPDVPPALAAWHFRMMDIRIFSSGSVLAQKLLFAQTEAGDLTKFIRGYFDTTSGAKTDPQSYRRIAAAFECPVSAILFISDITAELNAALTSGMQTALCLRPGNRPQPEASKYSLIRNFAELSL